MHLVIVSFFVKFCEHIRHDYDTADDDDDGDDDGDDIIVNMMSM